MHIFIDTSIIIQENYFNGRKLENLGRWSHIGVINLYMTTINEKEVVENIDNECHLLKTSIDTLKSHLDKKHKIVKNVYNVKTINLINHKYIKKILIDKFNRFKKYSNLKIVKPQSNFNISLIINDYFEKKAPFGEGKKKSEFPDAISFKVAEDYIKKNNLNKGLFLTNDTDFLNKSSQYIDVITNLQGLLDEILKNNDPKVYNDKWLILKTIKDNHKNFEPYIFKELGLDVSIYLSGITEDFQFRFSKEKILTTNATNVEYDIFDISDGSVGFKISGEYSIKLTYKIDENIQLELLNTIAISRGLKLEEKGILMFSGEFETTCYYSYEFPYEIDIDSIEMSEEKAIKSINQIFDL